MENELFEKDVKTRLIIAGIKELEEHGIHDFSLRRVALAAQVSCAAPYRHFKDKGQLIEGIFVYISSRWELFSREIKNVFQDNKPKLVVETCIANLRFWLANANYRSVLMLSPTDSDSAGAGFSLLDKTVVDVVNQYCKERKILEKMDAKQHVTRTLIYGTVMLVGAGVMANNEETITLVRQKLEEEFI